MDRLFNTSLFLIVFGLLPSCDSDFLGSAGGFRNGGGENAETKTGELPPDQPFPPSQDCQPQPECLKTPTQFDPKKLYTDEELDDVDFFPARLIVKRSDSALGNSSDHRDVEVEFRAGSTGKYSSGRIPLGKKGDEFEIPGVCTKGKAVSFEMTIYHNGKEIKPNRSSRGGIIGYRLGVDSAYIGYEFEAVDSYEDAPWHKNDDWIGQFTCVTGDDGEQLNLYIQNICFDQRIPNNGQNFIGKGDDANGPDDRRCQSI